MKHFAQIAVIGALGLALAGAAAAQQPQQGGQGRGMVRQACAADIQKLCPDVQPGPGGGMRKCIVSHQSELSDPCKNALAQMRARMQSQVGAVGANP
jgi:hypothetical protein